MPPATRPDVCRRPEADAAATIGGVQFNAPHGGFSEVPFIVFSANGVVRGGWSGVQVSK